MSKQGELTNEIRAALVAHGPLSTKELSGLCHSALEPRDISRAIYDLRRVNKIEVDPIPGPPNGDGKPAKRYRWVGQMVATHVEPVTTIAPPLTTLATHDLTMMGGIFLSDHEVLMPESEQVEKMTPDVTAEALAAIVEQADDAVMAYANSLLSDDPVWLKLRSLQRDCHGTLHDHRLARALTDKVG